jgi:hypothetical protein
MYRILLIETGEYLYKSLVHKLKRPDIYLREELGALRGPFEIIETDSKEEAEDILFNSCKVSLNGEFISPTRNPQLFEIIKV